MSTHPTIADVARLLETWAPRATAESYDNVGLQLGDARRTVSGGIVALDLTHEVIDEALAAGANLIITHHPVIFRPAKQITSDSLTGHLLLRLAEAGMALYAIHTNLDNAEAGVSFALAETLGLHHVRLLNGKPDLRSTVVFHFEPQATDHLYAVLQNIGFGHPEICQSDVRFLPSHDDATTSPDGHTLTISIDRWHVSKLVALLQGQLGSALRSYHVVPTAEAHAHVGLGAIGELTEAESLATFLERVAVRLKADALRYVGDADQRIRRVAVCGGSGSSFINQALAADADAYVTADVTYHTWFNALDADGAPRLALIDPGHYETEAMTEDLLAQHLATAFSDVVWQRTSTTTSPMQTYVPRVTS